MNSIVWSCQPFDLVQNIYINKDEEPQRIFSIENMENIPDIVFQISKSNQINNIFFTGATEEFFIPYIKQIEEFSLKEYSENKLKIEVI